MAGRYFVALDPTAIVVYPLGDRLRDPSSLLCLELLHGDIDVSSFGLQLHVVADRSH